MTDPNPMGICVVPDTNVWLSQNLLRSPASSALLFSLLRSNGRVGLPEVVELEVRKQAVRMAKDDAAKLIEHARRLGDLLATPPGHFAFGNDLPSDDQIQGTVDARFIALDKLLVRVPFSHEHARRALNRVFDETPPNSPKNQQFKDSAIWEALVELARVDAVKFISADKGFFENRDPTQGLAKNLRQEVGESGLRLEVYADLSSCLSTLGAAAALPDRTTLEESTTALARTLLSESFFVQSAVSKGWVLREPVRRSVSAFLTADPDELAITFSVAFRLARNDTASEGRCWVAGSCSYRVSTGETGSAVAETLSLDGVDGFTMDSFGGGPVGLGALDKRGLAPLRWPGSGG